MKLSEYLWKRIQFDTLAPKDMSPEEVQGQFRLSLNGEPVVSDTTGEVMNDREINSIYGRNMEKLNEAYKMGAKSLFELIAINQQISDDEWQAAKEQAEAEVTSAAE